MAAMKFTSAYDSSHYKNWSVKLGQKNKLDPGYIPFLTQIALAKGLKNKLEIDVEVALLVYEDALSIDRARSIRANRTRPLLKTYGITAGLAKIVFGNHKKKIGWGRLAELDLLDYVFEKIILDYPEEFQHLDDFDELKYICRSRLQNK
jgi:hypothetical protein